MSDLGYSAEAIADVMLESFLAGIAASDVTTIIGPDDPAFALGEQVGWLIRGAVALNPDLAPLLGALTKETDR